jgi:MFS family permease
MASEEDTERRPLLGDVSVAQDVADIPSETPAARRQRIIYVALIGIIVNSTVIVTSEFVTAAMSQLVEGAACQKLYPDITDPYVNKRCKNEPVQAELSFVIGWDTSIGMLPGLLTAIPFGIFAEKYGPRALLIVGLFGQFFNQLVVLGVCEFRLHVTVQPDFETK